MSEAWPFSFIAVGSGHRLGGGIGRDVARCQSQIDDWIANNNQHWYPAIYEIHERATGKIVIRSLGEHRVTIALLCVLAENGMAPACEPWLAEKLRIYLGL